MAKLIIPPTDIRGTLYLKIEIVKLLKKFSDH